MSVEKYISPFVQTQFPEFYKEYGPNFIAFVRAYYEWMESAGMPLNQARSLYEYADIDTTLDSFVKYFKNKYMMSLPESISADKRLMAKHVTDLYKSKGSKRAYELLFRLLFDEDIDIYIPGDDVFKLSDNEYVKLRYIEVTDNAYLVDLLGKTIQSSDGLGTAVVENFYQKSVSNKIINVLILSAVTGVFRYGQKILCSDLYIDSYGSKISAYQYGKLTTTQKSQYSLALKDSTAPFIIGSLSSIGITNGGSNFSVGDTLRVDSSEGSGGSARVSSVRDENGKVAFTLLNGGSGFSVNATITVTGGGGAGATFAIGGLVDKEVFKINTDVISDSNTTILDSSADGCNLAITGVTGTFYNGENVYSGAKVNVITADVNTLVNNGLSNGESLSNGSLGISSLVSYRVDGSLLYISGADITNANLTSGVVLISNTSSSVVSINTLFPIQNTYGNGTISFVNSSMMTVTGDFGYFVPGYGIVSGNTGATATVASITRNTDWTSLTKPTLTNKDLDAEINLSLNIYDLEVGTISYITGINPGQGYSSNPTVSILQQDIYDLKIVDKGGYKGYNAVVNAVAGNANGVVTSVEIIDSGFGYSPGISANLISSNTENQTVISGRAVVDLNGVGAGQFTSRKSFISDTQHIIDSKYWQAQSYDIIASRMLNTYEQFVRDLVHPSGIALFGTFRVLSEVQNEASQAQSFSLTSS